ncbi:hypothetical protein [Klebsiella aerogenes]|uniref:hypothetical protein n=1 Tax=Klebsiella aerogenes TaxID=548 RepID=UPI0007A9F850|nr:hypothetical protein [Klebsiella aerogenes]SAJ18373.1 Uncharacterised protein [Klebsiella aerogenes]
MNNELTAALLTIEKCRELSGCPAGVDLQDWVKQLAAESLSIKAMNDCLSEELRGYESDGAFDGPKMHLLWWQVETPATDRIVAGIKADGVEEFAAYCGEENSVFVEAKAYYRSLPDAAYEFAQLLREGADK